MRASSDWSGRCVAARDRWKAERTECTASRIRVTIYLTHQLKGSRHIRLVPI